MVREPIGGLVEIGIHTHRPLDKAHGILRLCGEHAFSLLTYDDFVGALEVNNRRCGIGTFKIRQHNGLVVLVHLRDAAVCGT